MGLWQQGCAAGVGDLSGGGGGVGFVMASVHTLLPAAACEKLAEDAALTTLMVVAFQRWYREQRDANANP